MNLKFYILLLFASNFATVINGQGNFPVNIRFDWVKNKGYYLETFFIANWYRANDFCLSHGMELATVETEEERDFVIAKIDEIVKMDPDQPKQETRTFWLGGNNLSKFNNFTWQSTGKMIHPNLWGPGEPNQANEKVCVNIWWSDGYKQFKLSDYTCTYNSYFACQVTI